MISAARPVRLLLAKVPACKKGLFEPDRLGTNIGKTQQKDCMSTQDGWIILWMDGYGWMDGWM
eukprot:COSAG06_NODE_2208_length_7340_cov_3.553515_12_plen_62_part_01